MMTLLKGLSYQVVMKLKNPFIKQNIHILETDNILVFFFYRMLHIRGLRHTAERMVEKQFSAPQPVTVNILTFLFSGVLLYFQVLCYVFRSYFISVMFFPLSR